MRVATILAAAGILFMANSAHGARLVITGQQPTANGGVAVDIAVDTEDAVMGFLGYQGILFTGMEQMLSSPAFFPPNGDVNKQSDLAFADLATPGMNFGLNDSYWLANGLSATGPGFVGGGVGQDMGFTGSHTALPVSVGGIVPLIHLALPANGAWEISGQIARIDDTGGFWVDGRPRNLPAPGTEGVSRFGLIVNQGYARFSPAEPSTCILAIAGAIGAALIARRTRRPGR